MKVTGKIEVFKGDNGYVGKLVAFNGQNKKTGELYIPVALPEDIEVNQGETLTIDIIDAYLNVLTSKNRKGEKFTHFFINIKDCKVVKWYRKGE